MAQTKAHGCARCGQELRGRLAVFDEERGGIPVIAIREISPRNWIHCDSCDEVFCHGCCRHPQSGYCDRCVEAYGLLQGSRGHTREEETR